MCKGVCACTHLCVCDGKGRGQSQVSFSSNHHLDLQVFVTGSLTGAWGGAHSLGWACWPPSSKCPSLSCSLAPGLQCAPLVLYGHCGSHIAPYACTAGASTPQLLSSQPMTTFIKNFILHFKIYFLLNSVSTCE